MCYFFHVDALSGFWKRLTDRKWIIHEKEKDCGKGSKGEEDDVMLHHMY